MAEAHRVEERSARRIPGLGEVIGRLLAEARSLVADYTELAVLDARRAAIRLAWLLGAVLVAAVLIVTTWMGLVAAAVVFMLGQGASWVTALIVDRGRPTGVVSCDSLSSLGVTLTSETFAPQAPSSDTSGYLLVAEA